MLAVYYSTVCFKLTPVRMEFKRILKSLLPEKHQVQQHRQLQLVRRILDDPDMFHLTRRSVALGTAIGLFFAFIPIPGQTLLAVLVAFWFRVNLPLAAVLTWITNPLTMPPVFYLAYRLGSFILGHPVEAIHFEMTWSWLEGTLMSIWPALLVGNLIFAIVSSATGFLLVKLLWRVAVVQKWERRKNARKGAKKSGSDQTSTEYTEK